MMSWFHALPMGWQFVLGVGAVFVFMWALSNGVKSARVLAVFLGLLVLAAGIASLALMRHINDMPPIEIGGDSSVSPRP